MSSISTINISKNKTTVYSFIFPFIFILLMVFSAAVPLHSAKWEQIKRDGSLPAFRCVQYGGGIFVAAGNEGIMYTSPDSKNWTKRNSGTKWPLYDMVYENGMFIIVGKFGLIMSSTDGINWTVRNPDTPDQESLTSIAYNGTDTFIAAGWWGRIMKSSDGINWSDVNAGLSRSISALCWGNGKFIAAADAGTIYYSSNGTSWQKANVNTGNANYSAAYANGVYVVGGGHGSCYSSTDGKNWTKRQVNTDNYLMSLTHTGSDFVASGDGNDGGCSLLAVSGNGSNWVKDKYTDFSSLFGIEVGNGYVVAVGARASIVRNTYAGVGDGGGCGGGGGGGPPPPPPPPPDKPTITITSPTASTNWLAGSTQSITWTTTKVIDTVEIKYTANNGKTYKTLTKNAPNTGSFSWTLPNANSHGICRVWIKGYGPKGNNTDFSEYFTIYQPAAKSITSITPKQGATFLPGTTENIDWNSTGDIPAVKLEYTANGGATWRTISGATTNDGSYPWKVPEIESGSCYVRISDPNDSSVSDVSGQFIIGGTPELVVDRKRMNFGAAAGSASVPAQQAVVSNAGGGQLEWTAVTSETWLFATPGNGTDSAEIDISVNPEGLPVGDYSGIVTVTGSNVSDGSAKINVKLKIIAPSGDETPFGEFSTPVSGTDGISGSLSLSGWALDDIEVTGVKIYRQVPGELSYIGDAVFVEGARPDVQDSYPNHPRNARAGWGYMLLTNFLPDGELILKAIATDSVGQTVTLGTKTVTLDNAAGVKPFGAIDTPEQGGIASGKSFPQWGWALTAQPNMIPTDGSTISIWVDGVKVGQPVYNIYRADIAGLFPGYANSEGAIGYLYLDTTKYDNGVHTIQWTVTDSAGNTDGIGSRYFRIQNSAGTSGQASAASKRMPKRFTFNHGNSEPDANRSLAVSVKRGYGNNRDDGYKYSLFPDSDGNIYITIPELERLELGLSPGTMNLSQLPIGSTLDVVTGRFSWEPAAGFLGKHRLEFMVTGEAGKRSKLTALITIVPKK